MRKELSKRESAPRVPPKIFRVKKSCGKLAVSTYTLTTMCLSHFCHVVTSRVQSFLPLLAKADDEMQQRMADGSPDAMSIENIADDEPHVEMVLT